LFFEPVLNGTPPLREAKISSLISSIVELACDKYYCITSYTALSVATPFKLDNLPTVSFA